MTPRHLAHQNDPVRQIIAAKQAERGITDAELSLEIGRNPTYINQYFRRGSPSVLPERERNLIAKVLGIDPALLDPATMQDASVARVATAAAYARSGQHVPRFMEDQPLRWANPPGWDRRPWCLEQDEHSFALRIVHDHGRLMPGDTAYVSGCAMPRVGDLVIVLSADYERVLEIGTFGRANRDQIAVDAGGGVKRLTDADHVALKAKLAVYV